jgi:murein L,D-transpeptidase YafK
LGDDNIEELFICAWDARKHGQCPFKVHIFPAVMRGSQWEEFAREETAKNPVLGPFWDELRAGYDAFEKSHQVPDVTVLADGKYVVGE